MYFLQEVQPRVANMFMFVPMLALVRPWTIVTYMFLHGSMSHLLFNMLGLWWFGSAVEARLGARRFLILYFISGITGAMLSLIFSMGAAVIGASAGVFGVMLAFARFWPDHTILLWFVLPVRARTLVVLTTLLSIWSGFGGVGGNVAHFAHLGGYLGALIYLRLIERRAGEFKRKAASAPPEAVKKLDAWRAIDIARIHPVNRDEVQRIISKANAGGMGALTPEEALFLSNFVPTGD
jgi:membrane associated rhomboid family serine protease